jgi:phage tail P2-like protein
MTDPVDRPRLLPNKFSRPFTDAIADVDGRLDDIDVSIVRDVKDPERAPAEFLPYLGNEKSVDVWDPNWVEGIKRRVIAAAPLVHAYKGTRFSIERALAALRVGTVITEWWERTPHAAPYTFDVLALVGARAYPDGPILDDRIVRAIRDTVMRTKPVSRGFSLAVGVEMEATPAIASAGVALVVDHRVADAGPATTFEARASVAAAGVALLVDHRTADAGPATGFAAEAGLVSVGLALLILPVTAEAAA